MFANQSIALNNPKTDELNAFSSGWWEKFLLGTNQLTEARVFPQIVSKKEVLFWEKILQATLPETLKPANRDFFRLWLNGENVPPEFWSDVFASAQQPEAESLSDWFHRLFGRAEAGVILNLCEIFDAGYAAQIAGALAPLIQKIGLPMQGFGTHAFIGNYSHTPIGIHRDDTGASVFHLHLGPGKKTMYLWEEEAFQRLKAEFSPDQKQDFTEYAKTHAQAYCFGAGDIFYMPSGKYHIGSSEGFSAAITIWIENRTEKKLLESLITRFALQHIPNGETELFRGETDFETFKNFDAVLNGLNLPAQRLHGTVQQLFYDLYQDHLFGMKSNGGLSFRPRLKKRWDETAGNFEWLTNVSISQTHPFELQKRTGPDNKLWIYCRTFKIETQKTAVAEDLLRALANNGIIQIADFVKSCACVEDSNELLLVIVKLLNRGGLRIHSENENKIAFTGGCFG